MYIYIYNIYQLNCIYTIIMVGKTRLCTIMLCYGQHVATSKHPGRTEHRLHLCGLGPILPLGLWWHRGNRPLDVLTGRWCPWRKWWVLEWFLIITWEFFHDFSRFGSITFFWMLALNHSERQGSHRLKASEIWEGHPHHQKREGVEFLFPGGCRHFCVLRCFDSKDYRHTRNLFIFIFS